MFISDDYTQLLLKKILAFLSASAFCALFGAIYEAFSHEVYSYYMIYAFALPLIPGAMLLLGFVLFARYLPGKLSVGAWSAGIATLTVGCLFRGVLDIYGTTNRLIIVYPIVGLTLLAVGLVSFITFDRNSRISTQK